MNLEARWSLSTLFFIQKCLAILILPFYINFIISLLIFTEIPAGILNLKMNLERNEILIIMNVPIHEHGIAVFKFFSNFINVFYISPTDLVYIFFISCFVVLLYMVIVKICF